MRPTRYRNLDPAHRPKPLGDVFRWAVLDRLTGGRRIAPPGPPAPAAVPDLAALREPAGSYLLLWIGHASFLGRLAGASFLIDPVFSDRIGLFYRRHGKAALAATDVPPLQALLVTHNHYDNLDAPSVKALPRELPVMAPRGLGTWFRRRGFGDVRELDWWEATEAGPLRITFVPARHWSGRVPWDTKRSHWGGFVVEGGGRSIWHAGDTAWFDAFAEIGRRFPGTLGNFSERPMRQSNPLPTATHGMLSNVCELPLPNSLVQIIKVLSSKLPLPLGSGVSASR